MKKRIPRYILFIVIILISALQLSAQPGLGISFNFSTVNGVAAAGTLNNQIVAAANQDDFGYNLPIGGNVRFQGRTYTRFIVSTNGWIALTNVNTIPVSISGAAYLPTNQLSNNTTGLPILAPYWDDLSSTLIQYGWTAPVFTVQWSCRINKTNATAGVANFMLKIDGNTGVITYSYANNGYVVAGPPSASIGVAGECTGDYYSYDNVSAFADSTFETTTIATKPSGVQYVFTPYQLYDNCANAKDLGPLTATCTPVTFNINSAITSGSTICSTTDVADVWFKITKPAGISNVTVTTSSASPACQSVAGTTVDVYSVCGGTSIGCATTSVANPNFGEVTVARGTCNSETLYIRVTADGDIGGKFNICVKDAGAGVGTVGSTCGNPNWICSIPYNYLGTTAGSIDNYDSTSSVCHTLYMNGEDYVFAYTPVASGCIQVDLTTAGNNPGVFVYNGCPNSAGTSCLASYEYSTGAGSINSVSLVAGQTYYIVVDNDTAAGNLNLPFSISVTSAGTAPAYDVCASAVNLGTIVSGASCSPQTFTTECSTPTTVGQAGIPSCVPAHNPPYFTDGVTGDVWLRFTAGFNGSVLINTFQSAVNPTSNAAMAIYSGASCPSSAAAPYACDYNSGANGMPSLSIPVANGNVYYIRVWTEHPENQGNFDICFQSACAPPNDLPCAAVLVPLGGTASGVNTCASSASEPANSAQCVAGGTINTVWYKAVVPASGQIRVRTHPLTLTNTQIQGFTFASGCANAATINSPKTCNDNGVACSGGFSDFSEQLYSGLTVGDTLFIAVDGVNSLTGSFEISVIDGSTTVFPPVNQQDCAAAQVVCSTNDVTVADPGFRNNGNICDLPSGISCWGIGERNSVWYQFTVDPALSGGNASVVFNIMSQSSTDIDFLVWDVTGLPNACQSIQSLSLAPAACNFAAAGSSTGLGPPSTGYFSPAIVFSGAPRTYLLLMNVYNSAANAGFTLNWGTTPVSTTTTSAVWSGLSDTLYTTTTNWGDCGSTPSCAVDATINPTTNQPTIVAGLPAKSVRNLTINAGARLRIKAGATLSVCGNFTNFGTLICEAGSTIQFIGTGTQTITGVLTGANSFANLIINKPSGSAQLMNNIDVRENFTTSNGSSIFNINGKYMKVGGNFTNFNGTTTFAGFASSTVEFNGSIHQNFTNSNGSITLNRVVMNKPAGKLYLNGVNSTMNIDSTLTLTSGIIVTRSVASLEVNMRYYLPAALLGPPSVLSYIDGKLRRKISNGLFSSPTIPASYDFPLGDSLSPGGYELANIYFTSATLVTDLLATFLPWPSGAPFPGPAAYECIVATYSNKPIFNNGYWTFTRTGTNVSGRYKISLFNTGFTNNTGLGWTVTKADLLSNPALPASWNLTGNCVTTSTAANTQRDNINPGAGVDSLSFNHYYATAQTEMTLPIELLYFTAEPQGEDVICNWETASEINNDYFDVERSNDGKDFIAIGRIPGFGNGTTTELRKYTFIDHERCENIRYYRLKQVDIDGETSYTGPVAVNCKRIIGLELYPNPANTFITYKYYHTDNSELTLNILDISGRVVHVEKINAQKGINNNKCIIDDLAAGVYTLRITGATENVMLQSHFFKN